MHTTGMDVLGLFVGILAFLTFMAGFKLLLESSIPSWSSKDERRVGFIFVGLSLAMFAGIALVGILT